MVPWIYRLDEMHLALAAVHKLVDIYCQTLLLPVSLRQNLQSEASESKPRITCSFINLLLNSRVNNNTK